MDAFTVKGGKSTSKAVFSYNMYEKLETDKSSFKSMFPKQFLTNWFLTNKEKYGLPVFVLAFH